MKALEALSNVSPVSVDVDVKQEGDKVRKRAEQYVLRSGQPQASDSNQQADSRQHAIEMFGLRKVYNRGNIVIGREFVAVKANWIGIYEGKSV